MIDEKNFSDQNKDLSTKPLKVSFKTFGCRSNFADTVDLASLVTERGGFVQEFSPEAEADVIVINSCTVTDTADREAIRLVEKLKAENPEQKIVVTGCMAESDPAVFRERFPDIEVIGPGQKKNVISQIMGEEAKVSRPLLGKQNASDTRLRKPSHKTISMDDPFPSALKGPGEQLGEFKLRSRFHLRVQEGCENHCTFCIIPKTRGMLSSRKQQDILSDLEALSRLGYQEAVLTGTHLGGYGEDLGSSLFELLMEIESFLGSRFSPNQFRIRLSSLDPDDVSFEMIDFLSKSHFFCSHLHICLQAFTDSTLKRMNRKYRLEDASDLLWYIHERFDRCAVGSDVITGFPGESRKELEEGIETFLSLPISYLHVFPYSEREGTAATRLDGMVPVSERKRRSARWRAIAERRREEFLQTLVGEQLAVVVEDRVLEDGSVLGTSSEFATVRIIPSSDKQSASCPIAGINETHRLLGEAARNETHGVLRPGQLVPVRARMLEREERRLICELSDPER